MAVSVDDIRGAMLELGPCKAKQLARALEVTVREVNPLLYRHGEVFIRSSDVPPIFELRDGQCSTTHAASPAQTGAERQSAPAKVPDRGWRRKHELQVGRLRLDVADLCQGRQLDETRWMELAPVVADSFVRDFGEAFEELTVDRVEGLTAIVSRSRAVLLTHPLWRMDESGLDDRVRAARSALGGRGLSVAARDVRQARSLPNSVYQLLV